MKYPTELIEKAEYEVNVFERVARDTGIELIEEVKRLRQEIAALRAFAKAVLDNGYHNGNAFVFGLIDENGNPTKILTGESE